MVKFLNKWVNKFQLPEYSRIGSKAMSGRREKNMPKYDGKQSYSFLSIPEVDEKP